MSIRIRPLRAADYEDVIGLFRVCGLDPRTDGRDSRTAITSQLRSNRAVYLGAFEGLRLVGTALGTHDTRKGWINRLAVHPDSRRGGIATRLVRECERGLRAKGIEMFAALIEPGRKGSEEVFRGLGYDLRKLTYARKKLRREI